MRLAWLADRVDLEVRNRRRPGERPAPTGHGVIGMRERTQLVGGRLDACADEADFVVRASLPIALAQALGPTR